MDKYEGVSKGHNRQIPLEVESDSGDEFKAITYIARGSQFICLEATPSRHYLTKILNAAKLYGLPQSYIAEIESLAGLPSY